ncbi:hypothetical protein UA08_03189 [Talaromyces atroroseus]|uniref:Protein kinase domain-containing protein n=1 Tax=Talaromyces atroroseus TaxID=1441469 RepID=A0A225B5T3_TALAT|nr:hypothetical protein UA08_03189 [Talaromyces atroroseus]OKL61267.1 hypothetical protein UA08_03189 [Talaromyces atroroseus]
MQFVRENLHIPVLKVLRYCSRASESKLGAEYIVMVKAPGVELGQIWDKLKACDKLSIVKQIAAITCTLARSRLQCHGALLSQNTPSYHAQQKRRTLCHHPSLLEYEGPGLDGFVQPALPETFESLDPQAKKAAKALFLFQSLWLSYEIELQRAVPELLHTFSHRETLPGQILGAIGSIYDDGEPYVQSLLADITEEHVWNQVVGADENGNPSVLCPLKYSERDMAKQKTEYVKWAKDVERKTRILDVIGAHTGCNGAVSPRDYDEVARRLAAAKQRFLVQPLAYTRRRKKYNALVSCSS